MPLLSFSIDLSKSTEAKALINEITGDNQDQKENLIREYSNLLFKIEKEIYEKFKNQNISLDNLFLVKSIGDEYWYVYNLDDEKYSKKILLDTIYKIILVLSEFISKEPERLVISEKEISWKEEEQDPDIWNGIRHKELFMPIKCFMDVLLDYTEINRRRYDFIFDIFYNNIHNDPKYKHLSKKEKDEIFKNSFPKLADNLNLGSTEIQGDKVLSKYIRFDAIGLDIDLFFRCAKNYSEAGLLRIGEKLFNYIASDIKESSFRIEHGEHQSVTRFSYFNYAKVKPICLKGIGKPYSAYTILVNWNTPAISGNYRRMKLDGLEGARNYLIENKFLKRNRLKNLYTRIFHGHVTYSVNKKKWGEHT